MLDQPAKRNAINEAMWRNLGKIIKQADADIDVAILVLRGEGDHFAAGADISEFERVYATRESANNYTQSMLAALADLENISKPTIALIRGSCIGGGCSIALACDLRFASETARFGVTPGKLGLVYSVADTRRLIRTVGAANAKDLLFTGRIINADEAETMNLCERIYANNSLDDAVQKFAQEVAETSRWSAEATKRTFKMIADGEDDSSDAAMEIMLEAFDGKDFAEGYRSFLEKRKPNFPTK